MTFVGKVLVVVQVVLSLCFMAFAGAVYTVQQEWKAAHDKKDQQLKTVQTQLSEQTELNSFLEKDLAATKAIEENIQTDYLDKELQGLSVDDRVKGQLKALAERVQRAEQAESTLRNELQQRENLLMTANDNYSKLQTENAKAIQETKERAQEAQIYKDINKDLSGRVAVLQDKIYNLEDQLFNLENDSLVASAKQKNLLLVVADLQDVIRREGIDPEEARKKDQPPPQVSGSVISTTKPTDSKGVEMVEISLGTDDGLSKDHTLEIFRYDGRAKYLAKIKLTSVWHDRAVGEVILKSKNGIIQRGDYVTTKL